MKTLLQELEEATVETLKLLHESVASLAKSANQHTEAVSALQQEAEKKLSEEQDDEDGG